jgi:DNA-binding NarL/FixJ family response regulator
MSHSALLRRGIRELLDDVRDITVVGESSSEQEAEEMAQQLRP